VLLGLLDPRQRQIVRRSINEHVREHSNRFAAGHDIQFLESGCLELVSLTPAV
jgi:hypothetical protein